MARTREYRVSGSARYNRFRGVNVQGLHLMLQQAVHAAHVEQEVVADWWQNTQNGRKAQDHRSAVAYLKKQVGRYIDDSKWNLPEPELFALAASRHPNANEAYQGYLATKPAYEMYQKKMQKVQNLKDEELFIAQQVVDAEAMFDNLAEGRPEGYMPEMSSVLGLSDILSVAGDEIEDQPLDDILVDFEEVE